MKLYKSALLIGLTALSSWAGRYALLIGHNDGGDAVRPLAYAEQDVKRFADILTQWGGFSISDVQVLIHPDSSVVADAFVKLKKKVVSESAKDNCVVVYYSGHADIGGLLLGAQHYSFESLYETFGSITTGVRIGIFDACYSGVITAFKGGTRAEPLFFENVQNVKGQVIIASSAASERAQESSSLKSSVFSFHLCNGLRGSADISGDKQVTLNEVYQYAYRKTVETSALTSGEIQHPVYKFNIQGQGDIVLTSFDQKNSGLIFDKNSMGKYLVLSENYLDVFADFFKEKGSERFILLNPGKYTVIRAFQKEVGTTSLTLVESKTRRVRDYMFEPDFLTESRVKGPSLQAGGEPPEYAQIRPVSQVSFAAGSGLSFSFDKNSNGLVRDAALSATALWYVKEYIDFYITLYGYPSARDVSLLSGLDYVVHRSGKVRLFMGSAVGLTYDYQRTGTDNALPLLAVQSGLVFRLGSRTDFGLKIPFTIGIDRTPQFRTGLEFRLQLFGRSHDADIDN